MRVHPKYWIAKWRDALRADADITRRRRHRLWVVLATLAAAASFLLLSATVFADSPNDPCEAPTAAPRAQIALLPPRLSFARIGTVTRVRKDQRHVMVQAFTTRPLDEVTVLIQDAVTDAGYRPAGMDNEGFEAEVFFTTGPYAAGQALVRGTACEGRWDIDLVLLDREAR